MPVRGGDQHGRQFDLDTWQVPRSDFHAILYETAVERGIPMIRGQATGVLRSENGAVNGVTVRTDDGEHREIHAKVVVDASGQSTFLSNAGVTGEKARGNYDKQLAVYSHFTGAIRVPGPNRDDALIYTLTYSTLLVFYIHCVVTTNKFHERRDRRMVR